MSWSSQHIKHVDQGMAQQMCHNREMRANVAPSPSCCEDQSTERMHFENLKWVCNIHMCLGKWEAFMSLSSKFVFFVCLLTFLKLLSECAILPKEIGLSCQDLCLEFLLYSLTSFDNVCNIWLFSKPFQRHLSRSMWPPLNGMCCNSPFTDEGTGAQGDFFGILRREGDV